MTEAQDITRKAKSNLAFALFSLPKENRDDVTIFYAFCRQIDDLADEPDLPMAAREAGLRRWKELFMKDLADANDFEKAVLSLKTKHAIPAHHFIHLLEGCEMDLHPQNFDTWQELQTYTHRVASTVGLICLPLFGSKSTAAQQYAETLGHALQLTNIIRDVGEDLDNGGRIYLPLEDMRRFNYTEHDLEARCYDERFQALMQFEAERAKALFLEARSLVPPEERKCLVAAEVMRSLYHTLLEKIEADHFQVFQKRYQLSKGKKIFTLVLHTLRARFSD